MHHCWSVPPLQRVEASQPSQRQPAPAHEAPTKAEAAQSARVCCSHHDAHALLTEAMPLLGSDASSAQSSASPRVRMGCPCIRMRISAKVLVAQAVFLAQLCRSGGLLGLTRVVGLALLLHHWAAALLAFGQLFFKNWGRDPRPAPARRACPCPGAYVRTRVHMSRAAAAPIRYRTAVNIDTV